MVHQLTFLELQISTNAKVDLIPDMDVKWFIDYNNDFIDPDTGKPVGTLIIPAFLEHENKIRMFKIGYQKAESIFRYRS